MKYKNIIFDFGNVIASFDPEALSKQLCKNETDLPIFKQLVFDHWQQLDEGSVALSDYIDSALAQAPSHLKETILHFFDCWYQHLIPLTQTWDFIHELKKAGYAIYILSNAPVQFAEHSAECYHIVNEFDGIVFSAPLKLFKPEVGIYQYLFNSYHLDPKESFFIDDKLENIQTGKSLGMDGIVFTGDIEAVKKAIDF